MYTKTYTKCILAYGDSVQGWFRKDCCTNCILNKAYRPNAHLFDIIMQLKYQFAIRIRFRISIKRLLVVLPVYLCTIS